MISSNSSTVVSRPLARIGYSLNAWPGGTGWLPILPAAAWLFSDWMASITSIGGMSWAAMRSGSSQIRMAYLRPNAFTSLTPGMRLKHVEDVDLRVVVEERRVVAAVG